jgi:uncharacterized protein (DUF608 family)
MNRPAKGYSTVLPGNDAPFFAIRARAHPDTAADGQLGCIIKFYRVWQLSGDRAFLVKHWTRVRAALAYAWIPGGWDADQDGVLEGSQHNTRT